MVAQLVPVPYLHRVSKVSGHREVIRTGDAGVTEGFHTFCSLLLKRENTSLKQDKSLVSLAQAARLIIGNAFFFVFRTQKGSHVKEHNEGVKSQIKEIKEDKNKLGSDGFNVEVMLYWMSSSSTREELKL